MWALGVVRRPPINVCFIHRPFPALCVTRPLQLPGNLTAYFFFLIALLILLAGSLMWSEGRLEGKVFGDFVIFGKCLAKS